MRGRAGFSVYTNNGALKIATAQANIQTINGPLLNDEDFEDRIWTPPGITTFNQLITDTTNVATTNWLPALNGNTYIEWSGSADTIFQGLIKGFIGQVVTVKNTGTHNAFFVHNSGTTTVGVFKHIVTSGPTPIAPNGIISWVWDGTAWQLLSHTQGGFIKNPFSATDWSGFSGMTWTVVLADVSADSWLIEGNALTVNVAVASTAVGGTLTAFLQKKIPNGYTCNVVQASGSTLYEDNGGSQLVGGSFTNAVSTTILFYQKADGSNWTASAGSTAVICAAKFPIQ